MTKVMGILNITPDSFSDGGSIADIDAAVERGIALRDAGADIVDVGGESTRPGAEPVSPAEELERVLDVVRELAGAGVTVSIDTMHSSTAGAAISAGASIVNDVSGGLGDPEMGRLIAENDVRYIAMHWRNLDHTNTDYEDVVTEVRFELEQRLAELIIWGVDLDRVIIDPGLGFAKTAEHNWQLLGRLDELKALGQPILIGASRKRFLSPFAAADAPASDRDEATAIVSVLAAADDVWGVRVHNVDETRKALTVWDAWQGGRAR